MDNQIEIVNLVPGKLYVAEFEVIDMTDLKRLEFKYSLERTEKQEMEALLKLTLKEKGHDCQFAEFTLESKESQFGHTYEPSYDLTGTFDLDKSTFIPLGLPTKTIRCYFRVYSITAVIMIAILLGVFTTSFLLVAPAFVSIMEAGEKIIRSVVDLTKGVIQEPRKLAELGIMAFIPVIALIAAVSFFVLKPRGAI